MADTDFELKAVLKHDDYHGWMLPLDGSLDHRHVIEATRALDIVRILAPDREDDVKAIIRQDAGRAREKLEATVKDEKEARRRASERVIDADAFAARKTREARELAGDD